MDISDNDLDISSIYHTLYDIHLNTFAYIYKIIIATER